MSGHHLLLLPLLAACALVYPFAHSKEPSYTAGMVMKAGDACRFDDESVFSISGDGRSCLLSTRPPDPDGGFLALLLSNACAGSLTMT